MIKHAFDAYPKVRTGKFTIMDSDQEEEEIIDYGLVDEDKVNEPVQAVDNPNIPFGEENNWKLQNLYRCQSPMMMKTVDSNTY